MAKRCKLQGQRHLNDVNALLVKALGDAKQMVEGPLYIWYPGGVPP